MTNILPFPVKKVVPIWGLTEPECDAIQSEAYELMLEGQATGISIHNDCQYICVLDKNGEPYSIGREQGVCYLFDSNETMLARSRRFEIVLRTLAILLTSRPDAVD
jgi:hypothetical protein